MPPSPPLKGILTMADWSSLPLQVVCNIVTKCNTVEDFVNTSVVARKWNQAAKLVKDEFTLNTTPWLLLVENTDDNPDCLRKVVNPSNDNYYMLSLPETFGARCWGSAYGWLVIFTLDWKLSLFNPLTKAKISFPETMPTCPCCSERLFDSFLPEKMIPHYIKKAIVLKEPQTDNFVVFIINYFCQGRLAFARPGDVSWTSVKAPWSTVESEDMCGDMSQKVADVICHDSQILILYRDGSLGYLEFCDLSDPDKLTVQDSLPETNVMLVDPWRLRIKAREYLPATAEITDTLAALSQGALELYLVNSGGNLFMVVRDRSVLKGDESEDHTCNDDDDDECCGNCWENVDKEHCYTTFAFLVYQLDFQSKKWTHVHDIGNAIFFLGNNSSMSFPASGAAGDCVRNCIYGTDDFETCWERPRLFGGHDMLAFNVETHEEEDMYDGDDIHSKFQTPLWFMPDFKSYG